MIFPSSKSSSAESEGLSNWPLKSNAKSVSDSSLGGLVVVLGTPGFSSQLKGISEGVEKWWKKG